MKKLLYTTSALVGAAFLMEAVAPAKAEVNISMRYRAALISQEKADDDKRNVNDDGVKHRSVALNSSKINIDITGEKEHPNGLTTGASLAVATSAKKLDYDNAIGYVSGSFGKFEIGDFHDVGYRAMSSGVPGTSNFGAVDAGYQPAGVAIVTPATGNIGGRGSSIAYWSPSLSGAQVGLSWSPQVTKEGRSGEVGHTTKHGDLEDSIGFAATYSNSFGGTGLNMGISFETLDQISADANPVGSGRIPIFQGFSLGGDKVPGESGTLNALTDAVGTAADTLAETHATRSEVALARLHELAGTGEISAARLYLVDGGGNMVLANVGAPPADEDSNGGVGVSVTLKDGVEASEAASLTDFDFGFGVSDLKNVRNKKQDGAAYSGFISFDIQGFTVGGSYGAWESPNHAGKTVNSESTAFALGGSYSVDAITFGLGYATKTDDKTYNNIRVGDYKSGGGLYFDSFDTSAQETTRNLILPGGATVRDIEKSKPYKTSLDSNILAFTVGYQLGDGAVVDFVVEQSESQSLSFVNGKLTKSTHDSTGFGVGIDLKF